MEQVLSSVAKQQSPVEGEEWPGLTSKEYKAKKKEDVGNTKANMENSGAMLDALTFKNTRDGVEIGFFNKEAWKADGHLKFSGEENSTPKRRFLPGEGEQFKAGIEAEVDRIILDAKVEEQTFTKAELRAVETKSDLYDLLMEKLGTDSRTETKLAVLRNPDLMDKLEELDLLELL